MTEELLARFLVFLLGLGGLGAACCGLRAYARDAFRQKAFAIRDELFDYAASGAIGFDAPAYWRLRSAMNFTIQYSHRMTFGEAIFPIMIARGRVPASSAFTRWKEAVEQEPQEVRAKLEEFMNRFAVLFGTQLLFYSPLAWPIVLVVAIVGRSSELKEQVTEQVAFSDEDSTTEPRLAVA